IERRNVVVALDHRRNRAESCYGLSIQGPHGLADRSIVSVDQVCVLSAVAGEMDLPDAVARKRREILARVEAVIDAADVYVVHIEQQQAVAACSELRKELVFAHLRLREGDVARNVLDQDLPSE